MLHNCEWEPFFPLSADVVANQAFIVAATAQSLQRQYEAFSAFVPSASPVKTFPSAALTSALENHFLAKTFTAALGLAEHLTLRVQSREEVRSAAGTSRACV